MPLTISLEITCHIQHNFWTNLGSLSECLVLNVSATTPHESISSVSNQALNVIEIKSFYIYQSPWCYYIPFGIEKHFQNLEILHVTHSGLKIVTNEDLKPLRHLKGLYLNNNELETLGMNLFAFNADLQVVNLNDNKLKNLATNIFNTLTRLAKLEVLRNPCIDQSASTLDEMEILKNDLKLKCPSKIVAHMETNGNQINEVYALTRKISDLESQIKHLEKISGACAKVCEMCRDGQNL